MTDKKLCPFFSKDDDRCETGVGYISPSDVQTIINHCHGQFTACEKYELLSRKTTTALPPASEGMVEEDPPPSPVRLPEQTKNPARAKVPAFQVRWPLKGLMQNVSNRYGSDPRKSLPANHIHSPGEKERVMAKNKGWNVALAGTGINLALGILYTWSIFKSAIVDDIKAGGAFNWDLGSVNDPYAVCLLAFAFSTVLAGRLQDKYSPRLVAIIGGIMVGAGFVAISMTTSYIGWVLGFGVLAGAGIGFGYAAAAPPALKWFGPAKSGLIAGIVVSGFGLAPVYISPLATWLLGAYGLQTAMLGFGIAFAIVVSAFGMVLQNPPANFVPEGVKPAAGGKVAAEGVGPMEMLKTGKFWTLWMCYFIGAGSGLMVIGFAKGLAKTSLGEMAFILVAIMAVGNAAGRIVAGIMADKIGHQKTLMVCLLFQAALMFAGIVLTNAATPNAVLIVMLATFIGFNYGTNLSLFPAICKDLYGMKSFGVNYGCLFTSWGVGGFVLSRASQMISNTTGSYNGSFIAAGVLLVVGAGLSLTLKKKSVVTEEVEYQKAA